MHYRFEYRDENTHLNNKNWIVDCDDDKEANNVAFELIAIQLEYKQDIHIELIGKRKVRAVQRKDVLGVITWKPYTTAPIPTAKDIHTEWLNQVGGNS